MASAVIGSLRVVLGIDTAIFDKGLAAAQKSLRGVGKSMQSVGTTMSAALTAPLAALGALTLKTAGDFEASMNRVGAATGATGAEFDALKTLARELGTSTSKSASEAADMLEMLAKNGLSAEQILDGAAEAAIKLSEATGGDLSRAADVATNVMAQFGLEAKDMAQVVDQITGVTLASQFGFDDYALALGQAGGVAGALGVSLTDFNAAIAATSDVFNSGSDAGTSFKTFLTRLVPASKPAAAAMKELGLEFFDASGNMKSLPAIAQELQDALAGLSDEARNDALNTIFGQDALRTAIALGNEGAAGIEAMVAQISKAGIAQEQADARMKGFNGEMEKLSGAFDDLRIAIGESGLLAMMTSFVSSLSEWVGALAQTNPEILKWGTIIAGVVAGIGPLVAGLGLVVTGFAALLPVLAPIGVALAALVSPIGLVVAAFAGIAAAWLYWDEIKAAFPGFASVVEAGIEAVKIVLTGFIEHWKMIGTAILQLLQGDFSGAFETFKHLFVSVGDTITNLAEVLFPGAIEKIKALAGQIVEAFRAIPGQMLEIGGQIIAGLWQGIQAKWESVKGGIAGIGTSISGTIKSTLGIHSPSRVMHEVGVDTMQGLANGMASMSDEVKGIATDTANAVATVKPQLGDAWAGLREVTTEAKAARNDLSSIFSGLGSSIAGLIKGTKDWRDVLADVLGQLAQAAISNISAGGSGGGLGGFLSGLLGGLVGFAGGGSFEVGGAGGIDSQLVAFKASPEERVTITKPGQEGGRGGVLTLHVIGEEGPMFRPVIRAESQDVAVSVSDQKVGAYNEQQRRGGVARNQQFYSGLKRRK